MSEKSLDRELEAILKLVELTQLGSIAWRSVKPWGDLREADDIKYSSVLTADYEGKKVRLFMEKRRLEPAPYEIFLKTNQATPQWYEKPVLEITNLDGASLWAFPQKPATADLLKAAQRNASGATDFIEKLLSTKTSDH